MSSAMQRAWVAAHRNVHREVDEALEIVSGHVPDGLRGVLLRNGPGRLNRGGVEYGHLFDGDGMFLRFEFGPAGIRYRNRFARTREYMVESVLQRIAYRAFGTNIPGGPLFNAFRMQFKNAANTNIIQHGGKVFALWEGGLPHWIDPDSLEVIERYDYGGKLIDHSFPAWLLNPERPFAAHPKIDVDTGELFSFGLEMGQKPTLLLYRVSPDGVMDDPQPFTLDNLTFVHDYVLTKHYRVFFLCPVASNMLNVLLGLETPVGAMKFDPSRPVEILIVPRDGSPATTARTPACFVFHHANGWDDGAGHIVIDSMRLPDFPKFPDLLTGAFDPSDNPEAIPTRFTIDVATGTVFEDTLTEHPTEMPRVHPKLLGRKYRYAWGVGLNSTHDEPFYTGVIKIDTEEKTSTLKDFHPNLTGEPVFVPRPGATDEDDGWVLMTLFVGDEDRTHMLILDARNLDILCDAKLPQHTPPGFHGLWLPR